MERERKRTEVTQLNETFATAKSAVVLGFKGLKVEKDTQFRKQIRDNNAKYRVSKNTLLRLAVKGTSFDGLSKYFKEVSAVATTECDVVGMVSVINSFLKENPGVSFKCAILDGNEVSFSDFKIIAELPPREVLIGRLLYLMHYPITGIAVVLDAICKQKEGAA
jgi:large subunit ribosomal protein L10